MAGGKKKNKGAKKTHPPVDKKKNLEDPAYIEANKKVLDGLLPLVSAKIDANGGVMKITEIEKLPDVADVILNIPLGFPTKLAEILAPWNDFFVPMSNGLVGTAMGYETGMIRENGTLDPAYASTFTTFVEEVEDIAEKKEAEVAALEIELPPVEAGNEKVELNTAAHELWRASLNPNDEVTLFAAFRKVQHCRSAIRGEPINAPLGMPSGAGSKTRLMTLAAEQGESGATAVNLSGEEREQRRMAILQKVLDKLRRAPEHTLLLNVIMMDRQIRELKKGAVSKMLHWLEDFKSTFMCTPIEGTPKFLIRLLDPNASSQTIMDSLPPSKRAKNC